jgi:hypothetical protein
MPKTRQQRRARGRRPPPKRKRSGTALFTATMVVLVLGGAAATYMFKQNPPPLTRGAAVGEHWHATYKIFICGKRMTNYPTVEGQLHSHGDGFMHLHPHDQTFAGEFATVGNFLRLYETTLGQRPDGKRELRFPDGTHYTDGDACPNDKKKYDVVMTNKGKPVNGDPAAFIPHENDQIVIRFGPEGKDALPNPYSVVKQLPDAGFGTGTQAPDGPAQQQPPGQAPPQQQPAVPPARPPPAPPPG